MLNRLSFSVAQMSERDEERQALAKLLQGREQKAFAAEFGVPGGPSMISQHLSGHRPISLEAAIAYARGLGVPISAFSPRLSNTLLAAQAVAGVTVHADLATGIELSANAIASVRASADLSVAEPRSTYKAGDSEALHHEVAHDMSHTPDTVPSFTWEELMQTKDLPEAFWVTLGDDALGPNMPKGTVVRFTRNIEPDWGNVVLLRDAKGVLHARVHTQDPEHKWRAVSTRDEVFRSFNSSMAGVERLAVLTAIETRRPVVF
jgi:hypothetical protein